MATIINAPKRRCDIDFNGPIAEIHFICGPVRNAYLTTDQILQLVGNGKKVYEYMNDGSRQLLTAANCMEVKETAEKIQEKEPEEEVNVQDILTRGPVANSYVTMSKKERKRLEQQKREQEAAERKAAAETEAAEKLKAALNEVATEEAPAEEVTEVTEEVAEAPVTEEVITQADA